MITCKTGDLLKADAEALVNTVNTVGIMGKGIALQFKKAFPDNFNAYEKACAQNELVLGKMFVFDRRTFTNPRYIINFPTKKHWRSSSRYEDIQSGLQDLVMVIKQYGIRSIAIPPLGSGLGGLNWSKVKEMIIEAFRELPELNVIVFEPAGAPEPGKMKNAVPAISMTHGRAALLELMEKYRQTVFEYRLSMLEIQKLMYFLQAAGENLKLDYQKYFYGPYADNLRHVLNNIEGHYITGYGDGTIGPETSIQVIPEVLPEAHRFLQNYAETRDRIEKVKKLIDGFETPYGMELLSSTHWVCTRDFNNGEKPAPELVLQKIQQWSKRKERIFKAEQIFKALQKLQNQGWLES